MSMKILRTPDKQFENLEDYPFAPHYVEVGELRIHTVDEGENPNETVLLMHGEPSWSYLYRKMIPILVDAGFRVIAPDLVGFGKSDKPSEIADYTYQRHVDWMAELVKQLDLQNITLFCQDWGSLIGLRVAAENPDRFKRIALANGGLPSGEQKPSAAFLKWREFATTVPVFPTGNIIKGGCVQPISDEAVAAYDAPFPDASFQAGARAFPNLVPISPDDPAVSANKKAWEVFVKWEKPFITLFSTGDPITSGGEKSFQKLVPGAKGQAHKLIENAGHFLQEDKGEELAELLVKFIRDNPI